MVVLSYYIYLVIKRLRQIIIFLFLRRLMNIVPINNTDVFRFIRHFVNVVFLCLLEKVKNLSIHF